MDYYSWKYDFQVSRDGNFVGWLFSLTYICEMGTGFSFSSMGFIVSDGSIVKDLFLDKTSLFMASPPLEPRVDDLTRGIGGKSVVLSFASCSAEPCMLLQALDASEAA